LNVSVLAARVRARARRHILDSLDERGLVRGGRIEFPGERRCELRQFEEAGPGPGELLLETTATVVSSGTERAIYLHPETISVVATTPRSKSRIPCR
jgi:hypothetical protein